MSGSPFVQKSQGLSGDPVSTFLDRATLQTRAESRRTVSNDGGSTPTLFLNSTITAKVFARGMTGQINSINAYFQNTGASGTVIFGFRPFLDASDEFYISVTVPSGSGWQTVNVQKSWLFDRLIVVVYFLSTSSISVGYDTIMPYDRYDLLTTAGTPDKLVWTLQTGRLYIQVTIGAQETEAVPVTGTVTVKEIQTPIIGGAVVIRPTADTGRPILVDRFENTPISWVANSVGTWTLDFFSGFGTGAAIQGNNGGAAGLMFLSKALGLRQAAIGIEFNFNLGTLTASESVFAEILWVTATAAYDADFRVTGPIGAGQMQLYDNNASVVLASTSLLLQNAMHRFKGIVDLVNARFVSMVVDNVELRPAATTPKLTAGAGGATQLTIYFGRRNLPAAPRIFDFADIVITQED